MTNRNDSSLRYGSLTIGLHWLSAALVVGAIALIEMKGWFPKDSALRESVKLWHFQLGAVVLVATVLRFSCLVFGCRPGPMVGKGNLERRLATFSHGALYLLLLILPVSGLLILIAAGKPVTLIGLPLPVWGDGSRAVAKSVKAMHELFGNAMIMMIALHFVAALWHQFVRRDGLMLRMMPKRVQQ